MRVAALLAFVEGPRRRPGRRVRVDVGGTISAVRVPIQVLGVDGIDCFWGGRESEQ